MAENGRPKDHDELVNELEKDVREVEEQERRPLQANRDNKDRRGFDPHHPDHPQNRVDEKGREERRDRSGIEREARGRENAEHEADDLAEQTANTRFSPPSSHIDRRENHDEHGSARGKDL